jgi:putative transposase
VSQKYAFIAAHHAESTAATGLAPTIVQMLCWLAVSRSGFYEWLGRPLSAAASRREDLKLKISALFESFDATYGYRRIHAELIRGGETVGHELVRKLMRELNLVPLQPKPYKRTTIADGSATATPDLVARDFTADRPGIKLVGDITYIRTWAGWLYLATVIDCHTKAVVGWAMADHYKTPLIEAALRMAARNHVLASQAIFHTDRGSNYTSAAFAGTVESLDLRHSVGRTGICYDNAMAESFFAALKNERVHRTEYPTREHARRDIARYIELRYNSRRRHSGLGYRTPKQVHDEYLNRQLAA